MKHITETQRYEISTYLKCGKTNSFIAEAIGVDKTSIGREIKRNSTKRGKYNPQLAQELCNERKERFYCNRKFTGEIKAFAIKKITQEQWSPEQIVGYCKEHSIPTVSHERLYQYVRADKANGGDLYLNMRHKLKHRNRPVGKFIPIKNRISIDERSEIVNKKERFGDWEIDTIIGNNQKGAIVTITERTTNFLIMHKLKKGKNANALAEVVIKSLLPYKAHIHTITADNGTEFAEHDKIAKALNAKVYFTNPYSSWEKGLIEYTNKLIRQYIPKKSNFNDFNDMSIRKIQQKINARPRKNLKFNSPVKIFYNLVA
jgi:transposase, IS30 family